MSLDYAAALIDCIQEKAHLQGGDTCLDLGSGTGSQALPLARRLGSVTACDISRQMLRHLEARVRQDGLANIVTRHTRWMDVVPFRGIGAHDTVIAHRSMEAIACDREGRPDFVDCVARMNQLTRRVAFIIPQAFGLPDDAGFRTLFPECTGRPAVRFPDLTTLNLLHAMGLYPRLEYVSLRQTHRFRTIDDEVAAFRGCLSLDGLRRQKQLGEYLAKFATKQIDGFSMRTVTMVLVMWWSRES